MRHVMSWAFIAVTLPGFALAAPCPAPDPAAVVKIMTDMYAAAAIDDGAKLAAIFTPDAVEYDGGDRFSGSALWDLVKTLRAKGTRFVWTVQDPDVRFACDTAWLDYVNRGSVTEGRVTTPVTWLEFAVLVHGNTGWRIRLFHSTPVPAAKLAK